MAAVRLGQQQHQQQPAEPRLGLAMDIPVTQLPPGDPRLVEAIVGQLKSKGIFDQFRKECLADVDTKPAFQNLRQRVEGHVNKFLEKRTWKNDINKNQLRDGVRKHVNSLGILDSGIDAIITQVVNPKIKPLILPYVEDTVYAFLQIDKPKRERQGTDINVPDESLIVQVTTAAADTKPSLLPMETDVISSEEDDILVRESPESEHKSSPSSHGDFMEPENEDAQDGFETFPSIDDENNTDAVVSHVEKLSLTDNTEESKPLPVVKPPLPLFDDQSLDSISSNSSGLTFSTLSGKGSPGSRKSLDLTEKDDNTKLQEPRSATSTPLVDEKPMDDEVSHSSVASEPLKEYPVLASEAKLVESHSPSHDAAVMSETPPQSSIGAEKDDQTVVSGASLISQDDDSQGSRGSTSKISISSYKSELEEKTKSEKSEGELSTSSSELSDTDNKIKTEQPQDEGKHHSDNSQKPSKPKSDHKSKSDSHSRDREREKDKDSKHSKDKDKEKKHSKSRDDHHSHRDKDKKHHRRDKDHDGDRERSRSHHHQSSSSSSKDGSSSGKSSSEKDKDRSSHHSGDKSSEGKSRRESAVEKDGKSTSQTESKSEGSGSESSVSSSKQDGTSDKSDGKPSSKAEGKNEKTEVKSTSKGEKTSKHSIKSESKTEKHDSKSNSKAESKSSKISTERTDKKHDAHSSKHSSKHKKHEGDRSHSDKEKRKSSSKDEKKKKDEKDGKKEKEGLDNKHIKEEKEPKHEKEVKERKHDKEGRDQKRDAETTGESRQKEDKDRKRSKEEKEKGDKEDKGKKVDKEEKHKMKDVKTVPTEDDKCTSELKLKNSKSQESNDKKIKFGKDVSDKKPKSHKESITKKSVSPLKAIGIKDDPLVLFNDEKNVFVVSYEDDDDDDDEPLIKRKREKKIHKKSLRGIDNTNKIKKSRLVEKTQKKKATKDIVPDFEGFSNVEKDTRLADFLSATQRVPDEMDMEYSEWFDENDLRIVVSESDIKERMDFREFLSCMHKFGAIIKESSIDMELKNESDSKDDNLSKTQSITEKKTDTQLHGKRRRISTSSSTSSSASSSGSPKHKKPRTNRMTRSYASQLVEQDPMIVSGFALLTPEDDGNRTSSRDYEVDYSQRINTYSPLSPASDSSAEDGKAKPANPGSIDVRPAQAGDNTQKVKDAEIFKPANTWSTEEGNLAV